MGAGLFSEARPRAVQSPRQGHCRTFGDDGSGHTRGRSHVLDDFTNVRRDCGELPDFEFEAAGSTAFLTANCWWFAGVTLLAAASWRFLCRGPLVPMAARVLLSAPG